MTLKVWIGGATADAQVDTLVISDDIQPGMIIKATIGSASITYTVPAATTVEQVAANFVSLWNNSTIPEFQEIEAATVTGGTFTLTMETGSAGKPFIVSFIIGNGTNEKQTITIGNDPTGGTFTLAYEGDVSAGIAPDASSATVQAALEALPAIGAGNVLVTGGDGGPWTVEFIGALAGDNASEMQANGDGLTVAPEVQEIDLGSPTGGTWTVKYGTGGTPTAALAYNISAAGLQTALEGLSAIQAGNVLVTGVDGGPFTITFQGIFNGINALDLIIDGTSLTGGLADAVTITEQTAGGDGGNEVWSFWEVLETDGYIRLIGDGSVSAGTWDFSLDLGAITVFSLTAIPWDVTVSEFQALMDAAIEDAAQIGDRALIVNGSFGSALAADSRLSDNDDWTIVIPAYCGSGFPTGTINNASLTGGGYTNTFESAPGAPGAPGSDDYRLVVNGEQTSVLTSASTMADIQAALEALSVVGAGNVLVQYIGQTSLNFRVTFQGDLANQATGFAFSFSNLAGGDPQQMLNSKNWTGTGGTSEVQRISIAGSPASGEFTIKRGNGHSQPIAYNQTAEELEDILEAVSTIGTGNVSCSGGPFPDSHIDVTFTDALSGTDLDLLEANQGAMTVITQGAVAATVDVVTVQATIQHTTTVPNSGPNDWNTDANWDTEEKPVNTDDVLIPDGDNILYGLDQSDLILGLLHFTAPDTQMGLPRRNANDDIEYLQRFLKVTASEIVIESGSQMINIDVMDSSPAIEVLNSGTGQDGEHAVQIIGQNTANTLSLLVLNGDVGIATGPKEAAYVKTITQRGGQVWIGQDVGLENVERTGGLFHADRTTIDGLITL